ncbi:MAG: FHA domain-containing protein [Phycisphaerales bacterium]|nr:MAG: FHA domain-containing protein [Phycisphaerales bacterium]
MDVRLIIFREDGSRRDFHLRLGTTRIGRTDKCGIRIPIGVVSRKHAEIEVGEDSAVIRDLGAANGTFLNNRRIAGEEDLEPGDQLMIGPVIFTAQIDGEPADDEIVQVRSKVSGEGGLGGSRVGTSKHVYTSDEEIDPISALEALASSAEATAINLDESKKKKK